MWIDRAMRKYIKVPYAEKDWVKERGARWDPEKRSWYIPDGVSYLPFVKWLFPRRDTTNSVKPKQPRTRVLHLRCPHGHVHPLTLHEGDRLHGNELPLCPDEAAEPYPDS